MRTALHKTLACALLAALTLPVLAQDGPAPLQSPASAERAARYEAPAPKMRHNAQRWEHMAQRLKEKLQLTPAQEAAWTQYQQAMAPSQHARLDPQALQNLPTPERIDRMRALREQRSAEADRRGEATKTFYAQLHSAQQKTFDAQFSRWGHGQRERHDKRHDKHHDKRHGPHKAQGHHHHNYDHDHNQPHFHNGPRPVTPPMQR